MKWKYKSPNCKGGLLEDGTTVIDRKCKTCKTLKLNNNFIEVN